MEVFEESPYHKKKLECIRKWRNEKLQETDYVVLSDVKISEERLTVIKNYRQELRDFVNKIMTGEIEVVGGKKIKSSLSYTFRTRLYNNLVL